MFRLWIDTNVARHDGSRRKLINCARDRAVALVAPAQVHLEWSRFTRGKMGARFDVDTVDTLLHDAGIQIEALRVDHATASSWAKTLYEQFPREADWQEAKRRAVGLKPNTKRRVSMTVDWWMVLAIEDALAEGKTTDRVVTLDKGAEWRTLRAKGLVLNVDEALAWIATAPATP